MSTVYEPVRPSPGPRSEREGELIRKIQKCSFLNDIDQLREIQGYLSANNYFLAIWVNTGAPHLSVPEFRAIEEKPAYDQRWLDQQQESYNPRLVYLADSDKVGQKIGRLTAKYGPKLHACSQ